ncbi:TPA: thymidylate synthase, partial [Salmonella enterica subsp. enterica serovar Paratyphi B]
YADNLDELIESAIRNIHKTGEVVETRAGKATQAYNINYILKNPKNRLHTLREGAIRYLCRELIAYFKGSLKADDGLIYASKFWRTLADDNGYINSNYGYYVFHEPISYSNNQYQWVIDCITKNRHTRRALININNINHKTDTKDFPCTVGILFYIKDNMLFSEVLSRSTDVITGLPYDMGFFSFIHELVYTDLIEKGIENLSLGYSIMKTTFTQLYEKTEHKASEVLNAQYKNLKMPSITSASETINDIINNTKNSEIIRWIYENEK